MLRAINILIGMLFCLSFSLPAFAQQKLKMATIAPGTSPYMVMTTLATSVNLNQNEYEIFVDAGGDAGERLLDLGRRRLDFAMVTPAHSSQLSGGTGIYTDIPNAPDLADNVSLVFWFPLGPTHVMTHANSGIGSLGQIRGKTIYLGPPNSDAYNTSKAWIKAATGMQAGVDYITINQSRGAAALDFQRGKIDVYISAGLLPLRDVNRFVKSKPIRLLGLSKGEAEVLVKNFAEAKELLNSPGRYLDVIPAGTYGSGVANTKDVYTIGVTVGVATRDDLDEVVVYSVTKTFWDNISKTKKRFSFMQRLTMDNAISNNALRLHSGALRYYQEVGLDVPQALR